MSYDATVVPGVLQVLNGISDLQNRVSDGPVLHIPDSPWCQIQGSSFDTPPPGPDLEITHWVVEARLTWQYAPDVYDAETMLRKLIEEVRAGFRAKQGLRDANGNPMPGIRQSYVTAGTWGYLDVAGVTFRNIDLLINVTEKVAVTYSI